MKHIAYLILLFVWVSGMVLAKGFWSILFAIFLFPFWSTYLFVEAGLRSAGWI